MQASRVQTASSPRSPHLQARVISGIDIRELGISPGEVFAAVEEAVRAQGAGQAVLEPRVHLHPPNVDGHFNVLRGHLENKRVSGVKIVGDYVGNYAVGLPSELALVVLLDPDTGTTRAMIDGTGITEMRTGALTALGARHLARPDSSVLGHVGARGTSWWNVVYLDAQFNFSEIRVTSRRSSSREQFAERLQDYLQKPVLAVDTVEKCLRGADIMVEATRLSEPQVLLHTEWVTPGTFVVPYGTISALDIDLLDVIDKVVVDDWGQATEGPFGALRRHIDEGRLTVDTLHAELADIVSGKRPGRESADERILFWHRGLSTTDVAVAQMIYERAEAANLGTVLTLH